MSDPNARRVMATTSSALAASRGPERGAVHEQRLAVRAFGAGCTRAMVSSPRRLAGGDEGAARLAVIGLKIAFRIAGAITLI